MNAAAWRAWLGQLSASPLCTPATLRSWTRAVRALESCADPAAARLIDRLLCQGAAMWQVAQDLHAEAAGGDERAPLRTGPPAPHGAAVAFAQLLAAAHDSLGDGSSTGPGGPAAARLSATLSGIALGALAAHSASCANAPFVDAATALGGGRIERQLRSLCDAIESGYDAHADSPEFAGEIAAAFEAWLAAPRTTPGMVAD